MFYNVTFQIPNLKKMSISLLKMKFKWYLIFYFPIKRKVFYYYTKLWKSFLCTVLACWYLSVKKSIYVHILYLLLQWTIHILSKTKNWLYLWVMSSSKFQSKAKCAYCHGNIKCELLRLISWCRILGSILMNLKTRSKPRNISCVNGF